jgi:predicted alpha/beta-fold hydrolase
VVYALDDPIIPIGDALSVVRHARDNPSIRLIFRRCGGHFGRSMFRNCAPLLREMNEAWT